MQTAHSDIGVFVRVAQESVRNTANDIVRTADLTANATLQVVPALVVHYGLSSRLGPAGTALAPRGGAQGRPRTALALVLARPYNSLQTNPPAALTPPA